MSGGHTHEHLVIMLDASEPSVPFLLALLADATVVSTLARVPVFDCHGTHAEHLQMGQVLATQIRRAADALESPHTKG
jgi:hypothetical protein